MEMQKSNRLAASGSSSGVGVKRSACGAAAGSSNATTVKLMEDLAHYKMPKLEQTPSVKVESGLEEADQKPPRWYLRFNISNSYFRVTSFHVAA